MTDEIILPPYINLLDKCKSFTIKTCNELRKWLNDDEFKIQSIEIGIRYPGLQQITRTSSKDDNKLVSFQITCVEFNKSLVEVYTFGYDAYRQVIDQLMQINPVGSWKIQLETKVEIEGTTRTIPMSTPPVHLDSKSEIVPYYIETFRAWEHCIVALVELHYTVLYLKINVFLE